MCSITNHNLFFDLLEKTDYTQYLYKLVNNNNGIGQRLYVLFYFIFTTINWCYQIQYFANEQKEAQNSQENRVKSTDQWSNEGGLLIMSTSL